MPVGITSPAKNLFLLGTSGSSVVANFFRKIQQLGNDGYWQPEPTSISYDSSDENYIISGTADFTSPSSQRYGWIEKRSTAGTAAWDQLVQGLTGQNVFLSAMELKGNDLIVAGTYGTYFPNAQWTPWIAKYTNGGAIVWQSTSNTANLAYTGIAIDSNDNYYACGNTQLGTGAFIEKFDSSGNPGWGKGAFMIGDGRDVTLNGIAVNSRGHVVAVGYLDDESVDKGYIVKLDTNTGEVLWDRTLESFLEIAPTALGPHFRCNDVHIDSSDNIYVVGTTEELDEGFPKSVGHVIKYSPEGNIIWQNETDYSNFGQFYLEKVQADDETGNVVVFGRLITDIDSVYRTTIVVSKYNKRGDLVFRRSIVNSNTSVAYGLDSDPSFYYLLFTTQIPDNGYTYGKVSVSGNGLGDFEYLDGQGGTLTYKIVDIEDRIGRLSDGSLQNSRSDLITYPFNGTKILFDDLATHVTNKKRQMDSAGSFEYSGSPAIRPADFQELNLLGDVYSGSGNWLDQSGKGNDGVVNGATWNSSGWWEFDGVNDYIDLGFNTHFSEVTLETWAYKNSDGSYYSLIGKYRGDPAEFPSQIQSYELLFNIANGVRFHVTSSSINTPSSLATNTWHHIVGTYDGTTAKIFVNGVEAVSDFRTAGNNTVPWRIGASARGANYLNGRIGEVRIYPRALTAAEVYQNYNATKFKYTNEPPDIAPKIGPGIVYDSNLLLNYDFGNGATYESRPYPRLANTISSTEQKIVASDAAGGDRFSYFAVAAGSGKIVVGSYSDDDNGSGSGSAYIYDLDGTNEIKITASDGALGDSFGRAVAVGNDKIVVGAPFNDDAGSSSGSAYIYDLDGTNEIKITASDAAGFSEFGFSVAVGNNRIVVGSPNANAAYIFDLSGNELAKIVPYDGSAGDDFGSSVAVGDNRIVIGAYRDDDNGSNSGSAYIFDLDGNLLTKITNSDGVGGDIFGHSVAVGDNRIVVGAYGDDDNGSGSGAAYIFDLNGNQLAKMTASDGVEFDRFGYWVAVGSKRIVVGAFDHHVGSNADQGAAYIFDLDGKELTKITSSDGAAGDEFGRSVAVGSGYAVIGAWADDDAGSLSGSAYIYSLDNPLSTTVKNLSSSSFPGTINGATFNSAGYFEFDNTNVEIDIGNDILDTESAGTVEAWINTAQFGRRAIFSSASTTSVSRWFRFAVRDGGSGNGNLAIGGQFLGSAAGTNVEVQGSLTLSPNTWHHVVGTASGTEWKLYVDGVEDTTLTVLAGSNAGYFLDYIGASSETNEYNIGLLPRSSGEVDAFEGNIGAVRIYNRVLTATEVSQNFNATRAKYGV